MKTAIMFAVLASGACTDYSSMTMEVTRQPPRMDVVSGLEVPDECPIYKPGAGDIDTPELPYPSPIYFACGVDEAGEKYGLVEGDGGRRDQPAHEFHSERESGLFVAFDESLATPFTIDQLGLDLASPRLEACATPFGMDCPAGTRIPLTVVAFGEQGMLLSFGHLPPVGNDGASVWLELSEVFPDHFEPGIGYLWRFGAD
ncbi:MAG TPA: hypothetical protein VGM90_34735 [Kofleriaceae bacterium]